MTPQEKTIVALDCENPDRAKKIIEELDTLVHWYKMGPVLFTRHGVEIIRFLHEKRKRIFVDLKLHDTPNVTAETVTQLAEMGVEYATVHLTGGRKMLDSAAAACRGSKLKLIGVSLLTSSLASDYKTLGFSGTDTELVVRLKDLALEARLSGMLCSPQELTDLRKSVPNDFTLVTAGIRIPGQEVYQDDQLRTASASEAIQKGADYLIVGRPITLSGEPRLRVQELYSKI